MEAGRRGGRAYLSAQSSGLLALPVTHLQFAGDYLDGQGGHAHVKEGLDALGVLGRLQDVLAGSLMGSWCWERCTMLRSKEMQRVKERKPGNCKSDCVVGEAPPGVRNAKTA